MVFAVVDKAGTIVMNDRVKIAQNSYHLDCLFPNTNKF